MREWEVNTLINEVNHALLIHLDDKWQIPIKYLPFEKTIITMNYSKYYNLIDESKYIFKESGIYSKYTNRKIKGYKIGKYQKYHQTKFQCIDGKQHSLYIHCALWKHFNGDIPEGYEINHKDGNQSNNKLNNLELLTHLQNMHASNAQEKKAAGIRNSQKIKNRKRLKKM